jgi:hypothetical protein
MGLESFVSDPSCSYCVFALGSRNETFPAWNCVCNSKLVVLLFGCLCVHVRFYDCCCACLCVCLDVCLFVSLFVHFDVACLFFGILGKLLVSSWHFGSPISVVFCTLGFHWRPGAPFCHPWNALALFVAFWGTLEFHFGLRLHTIGIHIGVFVKLWGTTLDPCGDFVGKEQKHDQKRQKKGTRTGIFPMQLQVFPRNGKMRFDCTGASGLRFGPLIFSLGGSILVSF